MSDDALTVTVTPAQQRFISWTSDVLVYTVVPKAARARPSTMICMPR